MQTQKFHSGLRITLPTFLSAVALMAVLPSAVSMCRAQAAKGAAVPAAPKTVVMGKLLGAPFESPASGIVLCPPAGTREIRRAGDGDEIVQFVDEKRQLALKVSLLRFSAPVQLATTPVGGTTGQAQPAPALGLLQAQITNMGGSIDGLEVLRNEVSTLGEGSAAVQTGLLAFRYPSKTGVGAGGANGDQFIFRQQALIRSTDKMYYMLDMTSLGGRPSHGVEGASPQERDAAELFAAVIESVQLEDRADIRRDQEDRLFRTRSLFVNLGAGKIKSVLLPDAWYRIVKNGKDIGFTEAREQPLQQGGKAGVRIDLYTRTLSTDGKVVEVVSNMFMAEGRSPEEWKCVARLGRDSKTLMVERGLSQVENVAPVIPQKQPLDGLGGRGKSQPLVLGKDVYKLRVSYSGAGGAQDGGAPSVDRPVPPWYIPQALGHLLPRLLPLDQPKTFLFGTYVSDQREVMMRYVDVLPETEVSINGKRQLAVPIRDRVGLAGQPTTHYLSRSGEYLGAVSPAAQIEILPSDEATISAIWKGDVARLGMDDVAGGGVGSGQVKRAPSPVAPAPLLPANPADLVPQPGTLPR